MASHVVHTLIEPSMLSAPLFRIDIMPSPSRIASALTSLAATSMATATATATDSPISHPTSTVIPPLPADINSPLANGKHWNPTLAILTLVAVIILSIILLAALSHFIFLRFRGKCPHCPHYEDELKKWKRGDLKPIVPSMVQERMRAWDLEKGAMDLQAKMYKDRMKSLACLEGRSEASWSGRTFDSGSEAVKEYYNVNVEVQQPAATYASAARRDSGCRFGGSGIMADAQRYTKDAEMTLVNDTGHPATHSAYLRDVAAPREAEAKRLLQEAEEQALTRLLNTASDPKNRESVQRRAKVKVNEIIEAREARTSEHWEERTVEPTAGRMPAPRRDNKSRFKERFSLE